jgi:hypothetical protein
MLRPFSAAVKTFGAAKNGEKKRDLAAVHVTRMRHSSGERHCALVLVRRRFQYQPPDDDDRELLKV